MKIVIMMNKWHYNT